MGEEKLRKDPTWTLQKEMAGRRGRAPWTAGARYLRGVSEVTCASLARTSRACRQVGGLVCSTTNPWERTTEASRGSGTLSAHRVTADSYDQTRCSAATSRTSTTSCSPQMMTKSENQ